MEIDDLAVVRDSIKAACAVSATAWLEFTGTIQAKGGAIVKGPKANRYQRKMSAVEEWCVKNLRPCRILGLKPRRGGSSTISMAMTHKNLSNERKRACVIGADHTQGGNLLTMLRLMALEDDLMEDKAEIMTEKGRYPNGSSVVQLTASNPHAGVSAGFEVLVGTEVAKWSNDGVTDAEKVLSEILKCVPNLPGTLIILESTAWGASGAFFDKCMSAITFEELQAGKDGFVLVFAPWFEFDDYVRDPALEQIESAEDYSEKEMELALQHNLTINQVAWMRWSIREECRRDFSIFCQDYPFDVMSAFLSSGRKRFNLAGVEKMKAESKLPQNQPEFGVIEMSSDDKPSWRPCGPDEARWMRWEKPIPGCAYIFPVDVMTGASQVGGKDPDSHAPIIWRKGYFQKNKGWVPARIVARMGGDWAEWQKNKKYKLWWDIDILEEQVWRGSVYYGGCTIAPEVNMDRGLIELLKLRGANIYQRELFNKREYTLDKALGWLTTTQSREMAIENLAKGIREHGRSYDGVDIHCPFTLQELEAFIVRENGRSEASGGAHDDNVISCFGSGTMIRCKHGVIPIEDVKAGDMVLTHLGRWRVVKNVMERFAQYPIEIKALGKPKTITTPEHPFLACRAVMKYKPSTQGMVRDYLKPSFVDALNVFQKKEYGCASVAPTEIIDTREVDLLEFCPSTYRDIDSLLVAFTYGGTRMNAKQNKIRRFLDVDKDLCRLIGFHFAQGCAGKHSVVEAFNTDHVGIRDWLMGYFLKIGLRPKYNEQGGKSASVSFGSVPLSGWFRTFGTGKRKRMPAWVEILPREKQLWILEGYFLGDGCFSSGNAISVTISVHAAYQLWEMAMRCGFEMALGVRKDGANTLTLSHVSASRLKGGIESSVMNGKINDTCSISVDQTMMKWKDGYLLGISKTLEPARPQTVFNLEVEEDESYTANGYVVHNCAIGLTLMDHATTFQIVERERVLPPDLQAYADAQNSQGETNQFS